MFLCPVFLSRSLLWLGASALSLHSLGDTAVDSLPADSATLSHARVSPPEVDLDRMVVRAERGDGFLSSTTVVGAEGLRGFYGDLPAALEQLAGVSVRRTGGLGEYAEATIRGASARQVQVFLDGVPLNSAAGGAVDLSKIPLQSIREVRVYRGIAPARFSGAGSGAVISLQSYAGGGGDTHTATAEVGSFGHLGAGALLSAMPDRTRHSFSTDFLRSDNDYPYVHDNGTPYNPEDDAVRRKTSNGYSSASVNYGLVVPIGDALTLSTRVSTARSRKEEHRKQYADSLMLVESNDSYLYGTVVLDWDPRDGRYLSAEAKGRYSGNLFEDPLGRYYLDIPRGIESASPWAGISVVSYLPLGQSLFLTLRGEGMREIYRMQDLTGTLREPQRATRLGATGLAQVGFDQGRIHAAVRYSHLYARDSSGVNRYFGASYETDPRELGNHYPNANAELVYRPASWLSLDLQARRDYLPPSFSDRFGWGNGFIGNPDLLPEKRSEYGVGFTVKAGRAFEVEQTFFDGFVDDYIEIGRLAFGIMRAQNAGRLRQTGIESTVHIRPSPLLCIDNSFHWINKVTVEHGKSDYVGRVPAYHSKLKNELRCTFSWQWLTLGHLATFVSPFYANPLNTDNSRVEVQPRLTAIAGVNYAGRLSLTYRIENYLYEALEKESMPDRPLPARSHFLMLKLSL